VIGATVGRQEVVEVSETRPHDGTGRTRMRCTRVVAGLQGATGAVAGWVSLEAGTMKRLFLRLNNEVPPSSPLPPPVVQPPRPMSPPALP
jgi:hypothetical protein